MTDRFIRSNDALVSSRAVTSAHMEPRPAIQAFGCGDHGKLWVAGRSLPADLIRGPATTGSVTPADQIAIA